MIDWESAAEHVLGAGDGALPPRSESEPVGTEPKVTCRSPGATKSVNALANAMTLSENSASARICNIGGNGSTCRSKKGGG